MTSRWEELWAKPEPTRAPVTPINGAQADRYAQKAFDDELANVTSATEGTRNDTLNRAAFNLGTLVGAGALPEQHTADALCAAGRSAGLDVTETRATVASGLRSGMEHPRALPEATVNGHAPALTVVPAPPEVDDDAFWDARPILWHLHEFARARRVAPWAVLGVTLARVAVATPWYVSLPAIVGGHASLNQFVGLVGSSGAGKGAASAVAGEAVDVGFVKVVKTGSGEGISHGYMKRTKQGIEQHTKAVLFDVPEIDTLSALGARQGATLLPELRSGWSGEALGFAYADPAKRLPVPAHGYRMCLVAGIQPKRAGTLLDDVDAGTPQRFLWLPAVDTDAPDTPPACPERWSWEEPRWTDLGTIKSVDGTVPMTVCRKAWDVIDGARLARLRNDGHALDGHALLAQLKAAASLALLDGRLEVTDDDWDIAKVIAAKSAQTRAGVVSVLADAFKASNRGKAEAEAERAITVDDRKFDDAVKRVAAIIMRQMRKTAPDGDWVPSAEVRTYLNSRDRGYFMSAVDRLVDAGQIDEETTTGGHLRGSKYRLREAQ